MKRKGAWILIAVLVLAVAVFATIHLATRTEAVGGAVLVNGSAVVFAELPHTKVEGAIVNGKGEETRIEAQGVCLSELWQKPFQSVTVTADDSFSATVKADEIQNAFLIQEGETFRMVVFGDQNSKRNVRNVISVEFIE